MDQDNRVVPDAFVRGTLASLRVPDESVRRYVRLLGLFSSPFIAEVAEKFRKSRRENRRIIAHGES